VALDLLHRAMPYSLLQCIRMDIKMACDGGTYVVIANFIIDHNRGKTA
jgi:hypothetical protein